MSWNAQLVHGPLEGQSVRVEEDSSNDPPPVVQIEGRRYVYCGFVDNTPRYRYDGDEPD